MKSPAQEPVRGSSYWGALQSFRKTPFNARFMGRDRVPLRNQRFCQSHRADICFNQRFPRCRDGLQPTLETAGCFSHTAGRHTRVLASGTCRMDTRTASRCNCT